MIDTSTAGLLNEQQHCYCSQYRSTKACLPQSSNKQAACTTDRSQGGVNTGAVQHHDCCISSAWVAIACRLLLGTSNVLGLFSFKLNTGVDCK
jgi:hypothetical protein